jgi:DNA-binding transcriptional MerR regulator
LQADWTITALSKKAKVPAGTLRYWERLGLLPRAARTHTGYRLFAVEALQYVEFVRKSKAMGLSLRQMQRVLAVARTGRTPCPDVEGWIRARLVKIKVQIRELQALEKRLLAVSRGFCDWTVDSDRSGELCSLIVGLPEEKKFRERNVGEPACFDSRYERHQGKNVHSKKTSR